MVENSKGKPCVIHVKCREGATPTHHRSKREINAGRPHQTGGTHQILYANSGIKSGVGEDMPGIHRFPLLPANSPLG